MGLLSRLPNQTFRKDLQPGSNETGTAASGLLITMGKLQTLNTYFDSVIITQKGAFYNENLNARND